MNVAYITDSFPPIIDGVSRCVAESAKEYTLGQHGKCIVVTPYVPGRNDLDYPFPVFRFQSVRIPNLEYRFGYPFIPVLSKRFNELGIDIIHVHSPFTAMTVARQLRRSLKIPIVYTQHTKWEFDIGRAVAIPAVRKTLEKFLYNNINAADDVWTVSGKTGEHICNHGFNGEYTVMENGTDFPIAEVNESFMRDINQKYELSDDVPLLLFVGRMMWYKNQGIIIDALEILKKRDFKFKMVFVGDGRDLDDMKKNVQEKNLQDCIFFAGRINNREELRAYYARSDMFVFPSTYDNAPLVIREAAACGCPSLVIRDSSASEILVENQTGFFAEETAESVAESIYESFADTVRYNLVKQNAMDKVYLPWSKVVDNSIQRYAEVCEKYKTKLENKKSKLKFNYKIK